MANEKTEQPQLPHPHSNLMEYLRKRGYGSHTGLCHGVAGVGVDILLSDDVDNSIKRFNRLIHITRTHSPEQLEVAIKQFMEKRKQKMQLHQPEIEEIETRVRNQIGKQLYPGREAYDTSFEQKLGDKEKGDFRNLVYAERNKQLVEFEKTLFDEKELDLLEIYPLFEAIELYYKAYEYPFLFEPLKAPPSQSLVGTFKIAQPTTMEGKIRDTPLSCSGIYDDKELESYLESLSQAIKMQKTNVLPFALELSCTNHSINLSYDLKNNQWLLIDINRSSVKSFATKKEAAIAIMQSMLGEKYNPENNRISLATTMHSYNGAADKLAEDLKTLPDWQQIHKVTKEKAALTDNWGAGWLEIASENNQIDTASELLKQGAKPTQAALVGAIQNHHGDMLHLLLQQGNSIGIILNNYSKFLEMLVEENYTKGLSIISSNVNSKLTTQFFSKKVVEDQKIRINIANHVQFCGLVDKLEKQKKPSADYDNYLHMIQDFIKLGVGPIIPENLFRYERRLYQPIEYHLANNELISDILSDVDLNKKITINDENIPLIDHIKSLNPKQELLSALQKNEKTRLSTSTSALTSIGFQKQPKEQVEKTKTSEVQQDTIPKQSTS